MSIEEARKTGAMQLFGEKYGEKVRVVSMGDFSIEFCGGTHVANTASITAFKILSENGVAAGVRRIEALTGDGVFAYYRGLEETLERAAKAVKATSATLVEKCEHLMAELKAVSSENESLKSKAAKDALGDVMDQVKEVKGTKLLATSVSGVDMNGLRDLGDQLKDKLGEGVVVLLSDADGKVNLVAMATDGAVKAGAHAGNLIKGIAALVGGDGGGREALPLHGVAPGEGGKGGAVPVEKRGEGVQLLQRCGGGYLRHCQRLDRGGNRAAAAKRIRHAEHPAVYRRDGADLGDDHRRQGDWEKDRDEQKHGRGVCRGKAAAPAAHRRQVTRGDRTMTEVQ